MPPTFQICFSQFSSVIQSCVTLCYPMDCSTPGLPVRHQLLDLLKLMSIELVIPSNHLILCCPLVLPSISPSIRVFSSESVLRIRWPKGWSFSFRVLPMIIQDWFPLGWTGWILLAVQGTLKNLLQHHSSKSINSSVLSFLYSPTFTSIHDYWKKQLWLDRPLSAN